jgi:hypothetical protein
MARLMVPRAAVPARPLQYFEVPALRRPSARILVPRAILRAQSLQFFELPAPRRCVAQVFFTLEKTSSLQASKRG